MAQPSAYNRQASFTTIQQEAPTDPLPGATVDAELNAVKATLDQLLNNLELIQRDDGELASGSVGREQLSENLSLGFNAPQAWSDDVNYTTLDTVFFEAKFYRCEAAHLSSVFADDLAAGRWELIADFSGAIGAAINIEVTPTGTLGSENVQDALEELQDDIDDINSADVMQSPPLVPTQAASDDSTKAASTEFVQDRVAEILAASILASAPPGVVVPYAGTAAAPSGWLFCDGSAVSRTTYSALYAVTGDTYGAGNGTTTFNVPDLRGRVPAGQDDMGGGAAAGRLTTAGSGLNGGAMGATGGAQTHTLTTAQTPSHTHTATVDENGGHDHVMRAVNVLATTNTPSSSGSLAISAGGDVYRNVGPDTDLRAGTVSTELTGITVSNSNTGGGTAHNNVQPTIILNYIIKT